MKERRKFHLQKYESFNHRTIIATSSSNWLLFDNFYEHQSSNIFTSSNPIWEKHLPIFFLFLLSFHIWLSCIDFTARAEVKFRELYFHLWLTVTCNLAHEKFMIFWQSKPYGKSGSWILIQNQVHKMRHRSALLSSISQSRHNGHSASKLVYSGSSLYN